MELSRTDHQVSPPLVTIPRHYNAAHDLIARHASRRDKVAYAQDVDGPTLTYGQFEDHVKRFAKALLEAQGARVAGSVSKKTTQSICSARSTKMTKTSKAPSK